MERGTTSSVRAPAPPDRTLSAPHREPLWLWRAIIGIFAGLWQFLSSVAIYVIVLGIGVSLAVSWLTSQNNADPTTWRVSQYVASLGQNLLVAVGVFGMMASIAFVAWRADIINRRWKGLRDAEREAQKHQADKIEISETVESSVARATERREISFALDDYDPRPMRDLLPSDCGVAFDDNTYLPRDADTLARNALQAAAARYQSSEGSMRHQSTEIAIGKGSGGIRVLGPHNIGKSRLVWEALHNMPELQEWHFVQWPSAVNHPFPVKSMKGKRVIILVDKLEDYAESSDKGAVRRLNRLPRDFASEKIPFIIIATLRDETNRKVSELASLVSSLVPVEVEPITEEQADQLRADLVKIEHELHDWDQVTPGSIITGQVPANIYKQLSQDAQDVLKILRLFDSVGFGAETAITRGRVCSVADALFDVPRLRWRTACDELLAQGLIDVQFLLPSYERGILKTSGDTLTIVSDYPLQGDTDIMEIEDWPLLFEVFSDKKDVEAIIALGRAWWESALPYRYTESGAPTKRDYLMRAAECFRMALQIHDTSGSGDVSQQALLQWYLGDVLLGQNSYMISTEQSPTRIQVLQEAATAYQTAREYYADTSDPDDWVTLTTSLANTINDQSKFLEGAARVSRLIDAAALVSDALTAQASANAMAQSKTTLAYIRLHQAQIAPTREEAASLLSEACAAAKDALEDRQESDPGAFNREALANAHGNYSYMLRFQASLSLGEERKATLKQSETLLRRALELLPEETEYNADSRIWLQSLMSDILLQLARLAPTEAETQRLLSEASALCSTMVDSSAARNTPDTLAWIQGVFGGICVEQVEFADDEHREDLLNEAGYYCGVALDTPNRESAPEDWAGERFNTALLMLRVAQYLGSGDSETACTGLEQGRAFLAEALDVYGGPVFSAEHTQALALEEQIKLYARTLDCAS
jgi:hypothetical protein